MAYTGSFFWMWRFAPHLACTNSRVLLKKGEQSKRQKAFGSDKIGSTIFRYPWCSLNNKRCFEPNIVKTGMTLTCLDRRMCPALLLWDARSWAALSPALPVGTRCLNEREMEGRTETNPSPRSRSDHFELIVCTLKTVVPQNIFGFFSMTFMVWGSENKFLVKDWRFCLTWWQSRHSIHLKVYMTHK